MEQKNLNIVVVGKSGAGKSSLLNYIVEKEIFETGIGSPVTQTYFNAYQYKHPNQNVLYNLFDTKGIEPDTINEFESNVIGKIEEFSNYENFFNHIHTLYFCVAASSKRIEPFEINFIKNISKKVDVVLVLTKSDLVGDLEKNEFKNVLKNEVGASENDVEAHIRLIEVCSVEITTRKGTSKPYGKDDVLNHCFLGLWNTFAKHLADKIYEVVYFVINTSFNVGSMHKLTEPNFYSKRNDFTILWENYAISSIKIENFSFYEAIRLPELHELGLHELTSLDRRIIHEILESSFRIYSRLTDVKLLLEEFKITTRNEIKEIIGFYSQLTSNSISINVPLNNSNLKIEDIKSFFNNEKISMLRERILTLKNLLKLDQSTDGWFSTIWNFDVKEKFNDAYSNYTYDCAVIDNDLRNLLNEYYHICQTEILSYGKLIISPLRNNENEKLFADEVRFMLCDDNIIDASEMRVLNRYRIKANISEERGEEIINVVKKKMNII